MNRHLSRTSALSPIVALAGTVLCLAVFQARGAPVAGHDHTLPSMFRHGDVYIKVSVNGHPAAWMDLDTGTTDSLIDSDYANTIGLKLTPKSDNIAGFGSMMAPAFTTDKVRVQAGIEPAREISFDSIRLDGMTGPDGVQLAGLLGHSFLEGHVIAIDYRNQEVYFEEAPLKSDPRDVPMTLIEGIPSIKLKMANQSIDALIDSGGSYSTIITPATAKALGIEDRMIGAKPVATVGHGGEQQIVVGKAPVFSIGDLTVRDMSAAYTTFGTATQAIGIGMSLGSGFLSNYKVTLNYPANTVRFEP